MKYKSPPFWLLVDVWGGGWGLLNLDLRCLHISPLPFLPPPTPQRSAHAAPPLTTHVPPPLRSAPSKLHFALQQIVGCDCGWRVIVEQSLLLTILFSN